MATSRGRRRQRPVGGVDGPAQWAAWQENWACQGPDAGLDPPAPPRSWPQECHFLSPSVLLICKLGAAPSCAHWNLGVPGPDPASLCPGGKVRAAGGPRQPVSVVPLVVVGKMGTPQREAHAEPPNQPSLELGSTEMEQGQVLERRSSGISGAVSSREEGRAETQAPPRAGRGDRPVQEGSGHQPGKTEPSSHWQQGERHRPGPAGTRGWPLPTPGLRLC